MTTTRRQVLTSSAAAAVAAPIATAGRGPVRLEPVMHQRVSDIVARLFSGNPAPALSIAIARGSGLIYAEALGQANLELAVPASPSHRFPLGSVSKVLTTTAAARLVSRGLLDLDLPISHWLGDLPAQHRGTTLRQLFTHRGGIRHYGPTDFDVNGPGGAIYTRIYPSDRDVLALFIDDPLIAEPGTRVSYSSYGYTLASMAMQAAVGMDFRQLIIAEIGNHFGLPSLTAEDPWAVLPDRAGRYMNVADQRILFGGLPAEARPTLSGQFGNMPMSNPAYSWAGAGFLATPSDAAHFGAALIPGGASRITEAERSLLFTPMTERTPDSLPLGLGWRIDSDDRGRLRWRHEGATPGGRYALAIFPELDLSVAIAGNVMALPIDVGKASADLANAVS